MIKKLWVSIKVSFAGSFIDRGDILLYSLSLFVTPVIVLAVWLVINTQGTNTLMSYKELVIYFLANVLVKAATSSWIGQFIPSRIRRGEISGLLLKPMPFLLDWSANNISEKIIKLLFLFPAVLITGFWLSVGIPSLEIGQWILVIVTTAAAGIIYFLLDVIIGMLAFWLEETRSFQDLFLVFESFFSGRMIPLVVLPIFWKNIAFFLPFRYMLSLPLEILLRQLSSSQIYRALAMQSGYLIVAILIYKFIFNRGIKRYGASGT